MAQSRERNNGGLALPVTPPQRCAIYTRKSTDENLDNDFNSLDAQREAGEAYIKSQQAVGWVLMLDKYDDGACSGATLERPALKRLLADIEAGQVDTVVVYKVDRLSRSLIDFTKLVEIFDAHNVSFVSVTQQFNTTSSMGRLTLNILLSFAQFEREVIGERIRDKVAASKRKGKWLGGTPPFGYDIDQPNKRLVINEDESKIAKFIFRRYLQIGSATALVKELNERGYRTKSWQTTKGHLREGKEWDKGALYRMLRNPIYSGQVHHKGKFYEGEHAAIIDRDRWEEVQTALTNNGRARGNRAHSKTPALLRGIIRCGHCDRAMTPTQTHKKGAARKYRYYLCTRAAKNGHNACPVKSVAAGEIEGAVMDQLRVILRSPEMVAETIRAVERSEAEGREPQPVSTNDVIEELNMLDGIWSELFPAEQERIFQLLVERVVIYPDHLDVELRSEGLYSLIDELRESKGDGADD